MRYSVFCVCTLMLWSHIYQGVMRGALLREPQRHILQVCWLLPFCCETQQYAFMVLVFGGANRTQQHSADFSIVCVCAESLVASLFLLTLCVSVPSWLWNLTVRAAHRDIQTVVLYTQSSCVGFADSRNHIYSRCPRTNARICKQTPSRKRASWDIVASRAVRACCCRAMFIRR